MTIHIKINPRKIVGVAIAVLGVIGLLWAVDAIAAPYPTGVGGTGTTASPSAGQVLIGTGNGAYTPAYILCAGSCSVASASGTVTITGTGIATNTGNWAGTWQLYNPSDFVPSSTQIVNTVNGGSGTITITSSTLGVIWPTVNGAKATNYGITATNGATSTLSGATTTISVSLNNGSAVTCSANQFLNTISATGTAQCGSITFPTTATYTSVAGSGISIGTATSSSNTTTTITNTGVISLQSSTQVIVSAATGTNIQLTLALNYLTAALLTLNGMNAPNQAVITGTGLSYSTSTSGSSATTTLVLNIDNGSTQTCSANQFVNQVNSTGITSCGSITFPAAVTSINGATSSAQTVASGPGISVSTAAGSTNSTTTVINTGVTSFTGAGCVTSANSTGTVALTVTCISGNQNITFTIGGDATGTATGTTTILDSITVKGLNGKALPANTTGTLQYSGGAWSINLATSSLGLYSAAGILSSYAGSSCLGGQYVISLSSGGSVTCASAAAGNVNVSPTSTIVADEFLYFVSNGSSTVAVTSSISITPSSGKIIFSGDVSTELATLYTHDIVSTGGTLKQQNASANNYFDGTLTLGSSTAPSAGVTLYVVGSTQLATTTISALLTASGGIVNASGTHIGATYAELVSPVAGEGDFTSIQPAITADCALAQPGTVFVKNGLYALGSSGLTVSSTCSGFGLLGESESSTRITYTGSGWGLTLGDGSASILYTQLGNFTLAGTSSGKGAIHAEQPQTFNYHDIYVTGFTNQATTTALQGTGLDIDGQGILAADGFVSNLHADHNDIDLLVASTSNAITFNGLDLYGQTGPSSTLIYVPSWGGGTAGLTFNITNLSSATNGMVVNTAGNIIHIGYGELLTNELVFGNGATDNFAVVQAFSNVTSTITDNSTGGTNDTFVMNGNTILASTTIASGGLTVTNGQGNFSDSGNGALNSFRGSTGNYDTQCIGTGSTAWWCLQLSPDGTNNFKIVDSQDGGTILGANTNGTTTIGNSGTGKSIVLGTSTTNVYIPNVTSSIISTNAQGMIVATTTSGGGGGGPASTTPWNSQSIVVASGPGIATISTDTLLSYIPFMMPQILGTSTVTQYYFAGYSNGVAATNSVNATNTLYALPIYIAQDAHVRNIEADCEGQCTGRVELGIYSTVNGLPGNLILDAGSVSTTIGTYRIAVNQQVNPGQDWLVIDYNSTSTIKSYTTNALIPIGGVAAISPSTPNYAMWTASLAYGALPSSFPTSSLTLVASPPYPIIGIQLNP